MPECGGCATASMASKLAAEMEVRIVFISSSTLSRRRIGQEVLTSAQNSSEAGGIIQCSRMRKAVMPGELGARDVSTLLRAWSDGDQSALDGLTPIVCGELR